MLLKLCSDDLLEIDANRECNENSDKTERVPTEVNHCQSVRICCRRPEQKIHLKYKKKFNQVLGFKTSAFNVKNILESEFLNIAK